MDQLTPKGKAEELLEKFKIDLCWEVTHPEPHCMCHHQVNQSAIVCVEEIIEIQSDFYGLVLTEKFRERVMQRVEYWESVLKHLKEGM